MRYYYVDGKPTGSTGPKGTVVKTHADSAKVRWDKLIIGREFMPYSAGKTAWYQRDALTRIKRKSTDVARLVA